MDNVNKLVVEYFKSIGFTLVEIKSSVFRIEESTLVFQTDHKDHTIDGSTILYKDAEKIFTQALSAERLALLTELRDSELLEEKEYSDEGDKQSMKYRNHNELGHNTLASNIKAHLDELIKSNRLELDNP